MQNVTGPGATGRSIRDQMDEIGERVLGRGEYKQLFSNDFYEVAPRYIEDMAKGVDVRNVLREMENVGLVYRAGAEGGISMDLSSRLRQIVGAVDESGKRTGGTIKQFENKIKASRRAEGRLQQLDSAAGMGSLRAAHAGDKVAVELIPQIADDVNQALRSVEGLTSGTARWLPKELRGALRSLNSLEPLPAEGWARILEQYAGFADNIGFEVASLRRLAAGVDAAAKQAGVRGYAQLQSVNRNLEVVESAIAQMNGLMARAALHDKTVKSARQLVQTL